MRGCLFNHEVTMKVINFAKQNTVVNQYVAELRDVNSLALLVFVVTVCGDKCIARIVEHIEKTLMKW